MIPIRSFGSNPTVASRAKLCQHRYLPGRDAAPQSRIRGFDSPRGGFLVAFVSVEFLITSGFVACQAHILIVFKIIVKSLDRNAENLCRFYLVTTGEVKRL
jgi:hypothetical protein